MPPTRKAHVIGAEFIAGQPRVRGVQVDKNRVLRFLKSDEGGAWRDDEIEVFESPRLVFGHVPREPVDFQLTYFAGHGFSEAGQPFVCLNDDQFVPVASLPVSARKSLVIIDACRNEIRDWAPLVEKRADFAGVAGVADLLYRMRCRWLYDAAIEHANEGATALFASSYDESAWGTTHLGGLFTRHLIQGAEAWATAPRHPAQGAEVLYANWAFLNAAGRIDASEQSPTGVTQQGARQLPFAVRGRR